MLNPYPDLTGILQNEFRKFYVGAQHFEPDIKFTLEIPFALASASAFSFHVKCFSILTSSFVNGRNLPRGKFFLVRPA